MPDRCLVHGCSNRSDMNAGISAYFSPTIKSKRDTWLTIVHTHRANLNPRGKFVAGVFRCTSRHLCPGLNAVTNFANFTIIRFSFKCKKFCDFSLTSTRCTKIRCLNDFSIRCAEIYNFMLIDQQAPACRFNKIYDFSLTSRFFNKPLRNLRFFAFLCNADSTY